MEQLREMIGRVARSQAPVHICGESGTGKELVARMIHESGPRRGGPFVAVNCGAIPTELMESELFGHKRGSFTGAVADKKGLVQSAEGGTLFLDEVADLPLHMQVKLLRVVQEKTVRPVGESREERGRCAHPLGHAQEPRRSRGAGAVPRGPLLPHQCHRAAGAGAARTRVRTSARSRRRSSRAWHAAPIRPRPESPRKRLRSLQTYPFPGNVRELENVLERALTLSGGGMITPEHVRLRAATRPAGAGGGRRYPQGRRVLRGHRRSGASSRTSSATRS